MQYKIIIHGGWIVVMIALFRGLIGGENFFTAPNLANTPRKARPRPPKCHLNSLARTSHIFLNSKLSPVASVRVVFHQMILSDIMN
jgi:hypothetical protein